MTREEAIRKTLDTVLWTRNASNDNKNILTNALVKALDQEPILDEIRAEIEQYWKYCDNNLQTPTLRGVKQIIDKYKAESEAEK